MEILPSERSLHRHMLFVGVVGFFLVGGVGGWATTARLSNAVVGEGTVIIDGSVKKIQHLTGGVVADLQVSEGAHVSAGDVLLRLDDTSLRANLGIITSSLSQLYARRARLHAERRGDQALSLEDLANSGVEIEANRDLIEGELQFFSTRQSALVGMKAQLEQRKKQLGEEITGNDLQIHAADEAIKLIDQEYRAIDSLYQKKLVTMQRVNVLKRQRVELDGDRGERIAAKARAEGQISEINLQIIQLDEDRRAENARDLTEVEAKIAEMRERQIAALDQLQRLDIRAPTDGRVFQLAVHTVGGVVNPSEPLMLLSPDVKVLTVEAKIASRSIDQIYLGQPVDIRFSAFDQRTTPEFGGEVVSISPDVVSDQRTGTTYYPIRIQFASGEKQIPIKLALYPGMPAEVFIKASDRTVISYLAKPITDQLAHTFREE